MVSRREKHRLGPPKGISANGAAFWRDITGSFALNEETRELLRLAVEALSRAETARRLIARDGLVFRAKSGRLEPHPAARLLKEAEDTFLRAVRSMGLER